jgi:hypothetical protein
MSVPAVMARSKRFLFAAAALSALAEPAGAVLGLLAVGIAPRLNTSGVRQNVQLPSSCRLPRLSADPLSIDSSILLGVGDQGWTPMIDSVANPLSVEKGPKALAFDVAFLNPLIDRRRT